MDEKDRTKNTEPENEDVEGHRFKDESDRLVNKDEDEESDDVEAHRLQAGRHQADAAALDRHQADRHSADRHKDAPEL